MRRCGRCKLEKPAEEFAWRRKQRAQRDNYCRPCRAAYKQEHYAANRQRYIDAAGRRKRAIVAERIDFLIAYLREHPCVDCGETDPIVLEFDHLRDKKFGIATGLRDRVAERPRRDGKVRGRLCKLSSTPHRETGRLRSCGGSSTVEPRPSKAMMRVRFPSAAFLLLPQSSRLARRGRCKGTSCPVDW